MSCLPLYQYDYFNEYPSNCVPEGYFHDKEQNKLIVCTNDNSNYYYNNDGKKICFKKSYSCPSDHPYLNYTTNECQNYTTLCLYNKFMNDECSFENNTNSEIYNKIKNELLQTYPSDGGSVVIEGENNYVFQITTGENELNSINEGNNNNLSMIDLGDCADLLKQEYNISDEDNLIIFKFEKITNVASEKNVQYEVYDPVTLKQLNLSICKNSIDLYIPITLNNKTQSLYDSLKESGYDLFNENDAFYTDICTPYESEDGTDVLLSDRKKDFYNNNDTLCQANCQYSSYSSNSKYLKCECNIVSSDIDTAQPEKFTGETIYKTFYDVLKNSNFGVLKCYKLVFNLDFLKKNYGSIIAIIYFAFYIIFVIIYIFKGISPFKMSISNLITNNIYNKESNGNVYIINNIKLFNNKPIIQNKSKKSHNKISKKKIFKTENASLNLRKKKKKKRLKNVSAPLKKKLTKKSLFGKNVRNNNIKKVSIDSNCVNLDNKSLMSSKNFAFKIKKLEETKSNRKIKENVITEKNKTKEEKLSNFELNDLSYLKAIDLDHRPFYQMYWAILRREHIILFTFCSWNDYNLLYVKFAKFVFLICQDMAMNVFFFSDDSMHKLYKSYGKYDFYQQIPQIIYSTALSQAIEVILCYLSLTDKHFYQIKALKDKNINQNKVYQILKCVKIKLIGFFSFTLIIFCFYWYFISAFCAVYRNTQGAFIKDSLSSFLMGLAYPFVLYLFPVIFRIISLKDNVKKRLKCVYKVSEVIPIF